MARITVEDCIEKVDNRFHLVQMTAIRTKQLKKGARALVEDSGNKEVVTALREIAAGFIKPDLAADRENEEFAEALSEELLEDYSAGPNEVLTSGLPDPVIEESAEAEAASAPVTAESTEPISAPVAAESTEPISTPVAAESTEPTSAPVAAESTEPRGDVPRDGDSGTSTEKSSQ